MAFEIVTLKSAGLSMRPITISISIAMDEAARSFEAKVKQPGMSQAGLLEALAGSPPCTIHSLADDGVGFQPDADGGDLLLTGHVERRSPSLRSAEAELPIAGRSKTGDLVDSSAEHESGEFKAKTAPDILGPLAKDYGITVESDLQHRPRDVFRLRPGETIFTAAERIGRAEGFSVSDTEKGNLKLVKAGTKRHAGSLTEGVNVLDASAVHDDSKKFSKVKIRAQAPDGYSPDELQIEAEASDDTIRRKRVRVIVPPELIKKADSRDRAKWHRDRAAGEGTTAEVTVPGWRDEAGLLWAPGHLVFTEIPSLGIVQDMLIKTAKLDQDDAESSNGTRAVLSLVDPRTFGGKKPKGSKSGKANDVGKAGGDDE
jgi:prophage tail gpP-like protein